jgi:crotonobetainyl-CoA:carnitine CoA-transferase CaiB-like acyl-CoA transferase
MADALGGIRVVDFTRIFAGPAATQILADLGADVVKIEDPGGGDDARRYGFDDEKLERFGASPPFLALNRNKRSVAIDLRNPAGREVASLLARSADVVVHNFRTGVMSRWRLDYEDVAATNPGVVYCDFSAYGRTGPLAEAGANDLALQAHSGLMSMTGEAGGGPVRAGTSVVDFHGGLSMACAIMAALFHRARTGEGQRVETSLLLSSAHLMGYFYTEYWLDGTVHGPMGTANYLTVPNQAFPTVDGATVIIASTDDAWRCCVEALDPERLDLPEFRRATDRLRSRKKLVEILSSVTAELSSADVARRLAGTRVVVSKVNSVAEAADHQQLRAIGGTLGLNYNDHPVHVVGTPFKMEKTPPTLRRAPPTVGEHTVEILEEFGLTGDALADFAARGAFGAGAVPLGAGSEA